MGSLLGIKIPKKLPLLVLPNSVLLPGASLNFHATLSSDQNSSLLRSHLTVSDSLVGTVVGVVTKEPQENTDGNQLHMMGTAGIIVQMSSSNYPRVWYMVKVKGFCRFRLDSVIQEVPFPIAEVTQLESGRNAEECKTDDKELMELADELKKSVGKLLQLLEFATDYKSRLQSIKTKISMIEMADWAAYLLQHDLSVMEQLKVLDAVDLKDRFRVVLMLVQNHVNNIQTLDHGKVPFKSPMMKNEVTRHISIQDLLGRNRMNGMNGMRKGMPTDIDKLEAKIRAAKLPKEALEVAENELARLKQMTPFAPENSLLRNYLELLADLPWNTCVQETYDIGKARADLNAEHYGLDKVKRRILEFLAVRELRGDLKGPILCFVGPPGVGKTSVARSVASTLGRPFHRISLGGISDQHDIRGHRRTYIGSMPGRIINAMRVVKVKNPVILLDEVDKMSRGVKGDPAAALLEVLDPEQNSSFVDTYMNVPFDLSQVLFVATANNMLQIPSTLADRMEMIHVPGYTLEEKVEIGRCHLIPKQLTEHGLTPNILCIPSEIIGLIVSGYTMEAGVRSLERNLAALCRSVAMKIAERNSHDAGSIVEQEMKLPIIFDAQYLQDVLGPPIHTDNLEGRVSVPGVALGLGWTPFGGVVLVVEASIVGPGSGLKLTGQLGSVMKESAEIALSWVKGHAKMYGINTDFLKKHCIHVHFPAGATRKDGPSAGVAVVAALVSLLSGTMTRHDVAVTGEVTLSGVMLAVGGIKEKVMAASRAGLKKVVIPERNKKDVLEIPQSVLDAIDVVCVNQIEDVLPHVIFLQDDKITTLVSKL